MTLDQVERSLERLRSRLYRTVNAIAKLEKAQRRLKRKAEAVVVPVKAGVAIIPAEQFSQTVAIPVEDDGGIPTFLQRAKPSAKDEAAKAEILAQQEATKKEKTAARIAKLKADKAGDRKKMPLQGKEALKAILG